MIYYGLSPCLVYLPHIGAMWKMGIFFLLLWRISASEKLRRSWFPGDLLSIQIDWIFTKRLRQCRLNGLQLRLLSIDPKSKSIALNWQVCKKVNFVNQHERLNPNWMNSNLGALPKRISRYTSSGPNARNKSGRKFTHFSHFCTRFRPVFPRRFFLLFSATKHLPISDCEPNWTKRNQTEPNRNKSAQGSGLTELRWESAGLKKRKLKNAAASAIIKPPNTQQKLRKGEPAAGTELQNTLAVCTIIFIKYIYTSLI